jgi:RimJ/RimL family protein N-acetyltransferase
MGAAAVAGNRVVLREHREEDFEAIEAWLSEAVAAAGIPYRRPISRSAGEERSVDSRSGGVLVIERVGDEGAPVGLVEYEVRDGWLAIPFIVLAKAYRGWGYGSEAVRLLEDWAVRERVAERVRVGVPVRNGLGLYFWLRLGFRPSGTSSGRDEMQMVREI